MIHFFIRVSKKMTSKDLVQLDLFSETLDLRRTEDINDFTNLNNRMSISLGSFKDYLEEFEVNFDHSENVDLFVDAIKNSNIDGLRDLINGENGEEIFEDFKIEFGILSLENIITTRWVLDFLNHRCDDETINKLANFGNYLHLDDGVKCILYDREVTKVDPWNEFTPRLEETENFISSFIL